MDRVWDTSKYHSKLLVTIFNVKVIQNHAVKEKSNWKLTFGRGDTCFWSVLHQEREKITIKNALSGLKRTKFTNQENAEIPGNSVKITVFDIQNTKTRSFFTISIWNFVHIYTYQDSFTSIQMFWQFVTFHDYFLKIIFLSTIFQNFQIFLNFENPRR